MKRKDSFRTFLMFHPGGDLDQWVPLREAQWSFSHTVVADNTAASGYNMVTASPLAAVTPRSFATTSHAEWTRQILANNWIADPDQTTSVLQGPPA
jgi:hypothetical protein